jgi:hypothetical protein
MGKNRLGLRDWSGERGWTKKYYDCIVMQAYMTGIRVR